MKRVQNWPGNLQFLLESLRDQPFEWGRNDCCTLAHDAYVAVTGELPKNMPSWASQADAEKLLRQKTLDRWITDIVEIEPTEGWQWARRGDLVKVQSIGTRRVLPDDLGVIGVCAGINVGCLSLRGLVFVPLDRGLMTWRVGD